MAASVSPGAGTFASKAPAKLFSTRVVGGGATATNAAEYAVAPNGRFLINQMSDESPIPITLILNPKRQGGPRAI
jgi:hypothetical protein